MTLGRLGTELRGRLRDQDGGRGQGEGAVGKIISNPITVRQSSRDSQAGKVGSRWLSFGV